MKSIEATLMELLSKRSPPYYEANCMDSQLFSKKWSAARRTACVQKTVDLSDQALRAQLQARRDIETDFLHVCAPIPPENATSFIVASDGTHLKVGIEIQEVKRAVLPYALISPPVFAGTIEILLDLRADDIGFCQYVFQANASVISSHFSPYTEADSSQWTIPSVIASRFELQDTPSRHGFWLHYLFVTFSAAEVFRSARVVGFNICRDDLQTSEFSAWNFLAGNGAQDGQSLGRLALDPAFKPKQEEKVTPRSANFTITVVNDVPDTLIPCPYTPEGLDNEARTLKQLGIRRVDWIDYSDSPAMWHYDLWRESYLQSSKACGDLLSAAARAAHKNDLEFIATIKLFDLTYCPFISPPEIPGVLPHWDGAMIASTPDIAGHPEAFMQSNPAWRQASPLPLRRLCLYSRSPIPDSSLDLTISTSFDNITYRVQPADTYSVVVRKCIRSHRNWKPDGIHMEAGEFENWCLEINLKSEGTFIHIKSADLVLRNISFLLVEAYGSASKTFPVQIAHCQTKSGPTRLDFRSCWRGWNNHNETILTERSWNLNGLGLAFIDPPRLEGMLEPAHPVSQQIWKTRIQNVLNCGADGVSLRPLCHHNHTISWKKYAFHPVVIQKFREEVGREPSSTAADLATIREIRGAGITELLRFARGLCDQKNARLIFQLETGCELPSAIGNRMQIDFDLQSWMQDGLVDELHLRSMTCHSPWLNSYLLPMAKRYGVKVHLLSRNLHDGMVGQVVPIYRKVIEDAIRAGIDGFSFYESAGLYEMNEKGSVMFKGLAEAAVSIAAQTVRNAASEK